MALKGGGQLNIQKVSCLREEGMLHSRLRMAHQVPSLERVTLHYGLGWSTTKPFELTQIGVCGITTGDDRCLYKSLRTGFPQTTFVSARM